MRKHIYKEVQKSPLTKDKKNAILKHKKYGA